MAEPMARSRRLQVDDPERERDDWIRLLGELVRTVEEWVQPEWSTRVIEKEMRDSVLGDYHAPALLMQREFTRVLLEPITRFPRGADGVVDLYQMPAYDDIARLVKVAGEWKIHFVFRGDRATAATRNAEPLPLTQENFLQVLKSIADHAA